MHDYHVESLKTHGLPLFSVLGFVGFFFLWILAAIAIFMRRFRSEFALPLLYIATYTITSLVPHTEARFGFPLVSLSLFALAYGLGRLRTAKSWMQWIGIGTLSLAALLFLWQVHAWDTDDALLNGTGPAHQALR